MSHKRCTPSSTHLSPKSIILSSLSASCEENKKFSNFKSDYPNYQYRKSERRYPEPIIQYFFCMPRTSVDDSFGMQVANRRQHLLDQSGTLGFRVMIIGLFVQAIEKLSAETQLLYNIYFIGGFIHLFDADNVGMIKLTHDKDFISQSGDGCATRCGERGDTK